MKTLVSFLLLLCSGAALAQPAYLSPLDFGLTLLPHGRIHYSHTPPNILIGNFNNDCYPDIARFDGDKLEVYIFQGNGYAIRPSGERVFRRPIKSLRLDGFIWDNVDNLIVTLEDGTEDTLFHRGGCLDLEIPTGFLPSSVRQLPPRYVCDYDFQIVWESEPHPYGMDRCAVGDLDGDGINELATWFKPSPYIDSAYALIYKSSGDDQYEISMIEPIVMEAGHSYVNFLMMADLDQNGQKELIFMSNRVYIWEFLAPGLFSTWWSNFVFSRGVQDAQVCDFDQDSTWELAIVTATGGWQPPCYYMVEEFSNKVPWGSIHYYAFAPLLARWQDWIDYRLAVGDFDNDGAMDIVSGNSATVVGYDPIDIQYFRYDTTGVANFTVEMLHTGIPLSCATPVIADFDNDGDNELFAGGLSPNGSSAFIWEATGQGTGYPAWMDTSTMMDGADEAVTAIVDEQPTTLCLTSPWINGSHAIFYLFGLHNQQYTCLFQSPLLDSLTLHSPKFLDMDLDGKQNLITAVQNYDIFTPDQVWDWEQTSSGVFSIFNYSQPGQFRLWQNYPNPFNSSTTIQFDLPVAGAARLSISNVSGEIVYVREEPLLAAGGYFWKWEAADLASGIYLARLQAAEFSAVQKLILLK